MSSLHSFTVTKDQATSNKLVLLSPTTSTSTNNNTASSKHKLSDSQNSKVNSPVSPPIAAAPPSSSSSSFHATIAPASSSSSHLLSPPTSTSTSASLPPPLHPPPPPPTTAAVTPATLTAQKPSPSLALPSSSSSSFAASSSATTNNNSHFSTSSNNNNNNNSSVVYRSAANSFATTKGHESLLESSIVEEEEGAEESSRPLVETLATLTLPANTGEAHSLFDEDDTIDHDSSSSSSSSAAAAAARTSSVTAGTNAVFASRSSSTSVSSSSSRPSSSSSSSQLYCSLHDFIAIRELGRGNYGRVLLVRRQQDNHVFAMKMLNKEMVIAKHQVAHTMTERDVMVTVSRHHPHPFLVTLHYAFQTKKTLYFIMDYVSGGELFFHLDKLDRFDEETAKFFVAEIALALGHLHKLNVIYRDLKPENVLIGPDGHVKLADFGLSKVSASGALTLCGTAEYFSPEALLGHEYNKSVDWWALGVLLYELTLGLPPFRDPNRNVHAIYDKILKVKYEPLTFLSAEAQDFMSACLQPEPSLRLGSTHDVEEIKQHPFFRNIDWELLLEKKLSPPYIPMTTEVSESSGDMNVSSSTQSSSPTSQQRQLVSYSWIHTKGSTAVADATVNAGGHRRTHTNVNDAAMMNPFRNFSFDATNTTGATSAQQQQLLQQQQLQHQQQLQQQQVQQVHH